MREGEDCSFLFFLIIINFLTIKTGKVHLETHICLLTILQQ